MKKKPMKPSPKMAKFVLTTWAACLARQKPVSTRAKPACMKMTRIAPITTHSMLRFPCQRGDGVRVLGERHAAHPQRHERRAGGSAEDVLERPFPSHSISLVRGP